MEQSMFPKNITYLLDKNLVDVNTLLKITNHKSQSLISMWKTGEREIITKDLVKIANHLGFTMDELVNKDISKLNKVSKLDNDICNKIKNLSEDKKIIILNVIDNMK